MVSIGKILGLLILFSLSLVVSSKNYDFQVTYQCENNEYKWFLQKLRNETVYGCKNWVQKILIKQKKNEFVRFQNPIKQQQQKAEQEQQKDFEQQEKKQKKEQKLLKYQQEEKLLEQIEQMQKEREEQKQKEREFSKQGENKQTVKTQTTVESKQSQYNTQTKVSSSSSTTTTNANDRSKSAHRLAPLKNRKLIQNHNDEQLTHKLASIFHNLVSPHNRHQLKSYYDSQEHQNQIRHYFQLRHTEEQQEEGEQEKFKPLKAHRSHPVQDVMFLLELIQMNSKILENTYLLHDEDIPSLQQLEKRHPKPVLPTEGAQAQKHQMQNFQPITTPQYLRTNN